MDAIDEAAVELMVPPSLDADWRGMARGSAGGPSSLRFVPGLTDARQAHSSGLEFLLYAGGQPAFRPLDITAHCRIDVFANPGCHRLFFAK